ncbi:Uncharacterized protein dnm_039230 [Desulfonema magnum]|uniref:Uncharacterized protein n=1 Tax=Desulfonema magnum TaxID=45655 RepID=A0A975GPG6_9BACT|nr:Uncharacterized protein dnm_039230 [Desulfonema magnum]
MLYGLWGNLNFYVPAETYGAAETCHAAIGWIRCFESVNWPDFFKEQATDQADKSDTRPFPDKQAGR